MLNVWLILMMYLFLMEVLSDIICFFEYKIIFGGLFLVDVSIF